MPVHDALDLNLVLLGKFKAQLTNRGAESKIVQFGGMQLMRHALNISCDFTGELSEDAERLVLVDRPDRTPPAQLPVVRSPAGPAAD